MVVSARSLARSTSTVTSSRDDLCYSYDTEGLLNKKDGSSNAAHSSCKDGRFADGALSPGGNNLGRIGRRLRRWNWVRPGEVASRRAQFEDLKPIQNGVVVHRLCGLVRVEGDPKILLVRAPRNDDNVVLVHRDADPPAGGDHVDILLSRPEEVDVLNGGDGVPTHVQPVHGLQRRALVDRVGCGRADDGEELGAEEIGHGNDLDAVHEGVSVGNTGRWCEGEVEGARRDIDGEFSGDASKLEGLGGLGGAEVALQGEVAGVSGDGEARIAGEVGTIVGRVEVEADELATGRNGEGVGEGGRGDAGGHVGDLRDGWILCGRGGGQGVILLILLHARGPAAEEDIVADDGGGVPGGGVAGKEEEGGEEEEEAGEGKEVVVAAVLGTGARHGDPTQKLWMIADTLLHRYSSNSGKD
ncbi:hypothetical protein Taro_035652 [Colocasia esculenta]|uniref:Uncharacterized protein n=1 Tax=Colocasia esculenta TaxID=4460 RepID=A0A843W4G5_COLES|nr:hypothetical protein [Colocasia esculenta]